MANKNQYFPQTVSHPGETLEEKLGEMNMEPKEFSDATGLPEKTIIEPPLITSILKKLRIEVFPGICLF